jgi:hypothetical protein
MDAVWAQGAEYQWSAECNKRWCENRRECASLARKALFLKNCRVVELSMYPSEVNMPQKSSQSTVVQALATAAVLGILLGVVLFGKGCNSPPCYRNNPLDDDTIERIEDIAAFVNGIDAILDAKSSYDTVVDLNQLDALEDILEYIGKDKVKQKALELAVENIPALRNAKLTYEQLRSLSTELDDAVRSGDAKQVAAVAAKGARLLRRVRAGLELLTPLIPAERRADWNTYLAQLGTDIRALSALASACTTEPGEEGARRCGHADHRPSSIQEDAWESYECREGTKSEGCLKRSQYSKREGTGCAGRELCCPR